MSFSELSRLNRQGVSSACLKIHLLGEVQVFANGELVHFHTKKACCVFCCLVSHSQRAHSRAGLADMCWGHLDDKKARDNLNTAISSLRRSLKTCETSNDLIIANRRLVQFNVQSDHWIDVDEFEQLIQQAREQQDCSAYAKAMALWQGDFMQDFNKDWCNSIRSRLRSLMLEACDALIKSSQDQQHLEQAISWAHQILQSVPEREQTHYKLMELYAEMGDQKAALDQFDRCLGALSDIGVQPHRQTKSFYHKIKQGELPFLPIE